MDLIDNSIFRIFEFGIMIFVVILLVILIIRLVTTLIAPISIYLNYRNYQRRLSQNGEFKNNIHSKYFSKNLRNSCISLILILVLFLPLYNIRRDVVKHVDYNEYSTWKDNTEDQMEQLKLEEVFTHNPEFFSRFYYERKYNAYREIDSEKVLVTSYEVAYTTGLKLLINTYVDLAWVIGDYFFKNIYDYDGISIIEATDEFGTGLLLLITFLTWTHYVITIRKHSLLIVPKNEKQIESFISREQKLFLRAWASLLSLVALLIYNKGLDSLRGGMLLMILSIVIIWLTNEYKVLSEVKKIILGTLTRTDKKKSCNDNN